MPLSTESRMLVLVYIHSDEVTSITFDLNICRRKPFILGLIDISKREFIWRLLLTNRTGGK